MQRYGFVYIWYDRKHKRFYIGCRWGNEEDKYICSSTWMKQGYKHRPQDFKRRILSRIYTNKQDLLHEEYRWLQMIPKNELGKKYYNLHNHHFGHWSSNSNTEKIVGQKISQSNKGRKVPNRKSPTPFTEEHRRKMSERMMGQTYRLGTKHSDLTKQKMSIAHKGVRVKEESRQKISNTLLGHSVSPETREKISIIQKGKVLSEETRRKMSVSKKGRPRVPGSGRKRIG